MKNNLVAILILLSLKSSAQKLYSTTYLKFNNQEVKSKDSADFVRYIYHPENGATTTKLIEKFKSDTLKKVGNLTVKGLPLNVFEGEVKDYHTNGKIKLIQTYFRGRLDGNTTSFNFKGDTLHVGKYIIGYDGGSYLKCDKVFKAKGENILDEHGNGVLEQRSYSEKTKIIYKNGFRDGLCYQQFLLSKIVFQEKFYKGKFVEGKMIDINGNENKYKELFSFPYCEGQQFMKSFGDDGVRPVATIIKSNDLDGRVIYSFDIDRFGRLSNFKLLQSLSEYSDKKALNYIQTKKWHSASIRGQTYDTYGFIYIVGYHLD